MKIRDAITYPPLKNGRLVYERQVGFTDYGEAMQAYDIAGQIADRADKSGHYGKLLVRNARHINTGFADARDIDPGAFADRLREYVWNVPVGASDAAKAGRTDGLLSVTETRLLKVVLWAGANMAYEPPGLGGVDKGVRRRSVALKGAMHIAGERLKTFRQELVAEGRLPDMLPDGVEEAEMGRDKIHVLATSADVSSANSQRADSYWRLTLGGYALLGAEDRQATQLSVWGRET